MHNTQRRSRKTLTALLIAAALFLGSLGGLGAVVAGSPAQPAASHAPARVADDLPTPTSAPGGHDPNTGTNGGGGH